MSYITYTSTGPFVNGGAPGISASFLNALENFCSAGWFDSQITSNHSGVLTALGLVTGSGLLSLASHAQSVNGSTSGTLTINEYMTGSGLKIVTCYFNSYKNAGAAQSITLNTAFSVGCIALNLGGNGLNLLVGSTSQNISALTSLGSSSSGSSATVTNLLDWSIGVCMAAVTGVKEPGSNSSTATGLFAILGY